MIPLVAPTITRSDRKGVADAAWNGMLTSDRYVRTFEEKFAEYVGCKGAVAVNSGTSAIRLALELSFDFGYPCEPPPALTLPSYSCRALENAAYELDIRVKYADTHFDVETAQARQEQTVGVLVHLFGKQTLTAERPYVEDWTLSLGGVSPTDTDVLCVCSTAKSKMISTDRGGLIFGNDLSLLNEIRALAYYDDEPAGRPNSYSLGMTSMQAVLGISQLAQLDDFIARRRSTAAIYSNRFTTVGIICPDPDCGSVFFRYLIATTSPAAKVDQLAARGIQAGRGVFPPLHFAPHNITEDDLYPGVLENVRTLLSVPVHPSLTDTQVEYIAEQVAEVCAP